MANKSTKTVVVYTDGVYDLFHRGHLEALRKAKEYASEVRLIVGVMSDEDCASYKRVPIFNEEDRHLIINSIKYVDQVVFPAPYVITREFVEKHSIDIYLHGFSNQADFQKQQVMFEPIKDLLGQLPYYRGNSTTTIIQKIKQEY